MSCRFPASCQCVVLYGSLYNSPVLQLPLGVSCANYVFWTRWLPGWKSVIKKSVLYSSKNYAHLTWQQSKISQRYMKNDIEISGDVHLRRLHIWNFSVVYPCIARYNHECSWCSVRNFFGRVMIYWNFIPMLPVVSLTIGHHWFR